MKTLRLAGILLASMLVIGYASFVAACVPPKPGDVNGDGIVGLEDVVITAKAWHTHDGDNGWDERCDCNGDGYISLEDLVWIAAHYEG